MIIAFFHRPMFFGYFSIVQQIDNKILKGYLFVSSFLGWGVGVRYLKSAKFWGPKMQLILVKM